MIENNSSCFLRVLLNYPLQRAGLGGCVLRSLIKRLNGVSPGLQRVNLIMIPRRKTAGSSEAQLQKPANWIIFLNSVTFLGNQVFFFLSSKA